VGRSPPQLCFRREGTDGRVACRWRPKVRRSRTLGLGPRLSEAASRHVRHTSRTGRCFSLGRAANSHSRRFSGLASSPHYDLMNGQRTLILGLVEQGLELPKIHWD